MKMWLARDKRYINAEGIQRGGQYSLWYKKKPGLTSIHGRAGLEKKVKWFGPFHNLVNFFDKNPFSEIKLKEGEIVELTVSAKRQGPSAKSRKK